MWSSRNRWTLVTVLVVLATVLPVALDRDSFPLSTYPMYARARQSEVSFVTAVGVDAAGEVERLSLRSIGASDDPLIVAGELRSAVADGRASQRCDEIADRLASERLRERDSAATTDTTASVVAVEVVTERHDVIAQVAGRPSEIDRIVHARCAVEPAR